MPQKCLFVCLICLGSEMGMTRSESIGEMNLFKIFSCLYRELV